MELDETSTDGRPGGVSEVRQELGLTTFLGAVFHEIFCVLISPLPGAIRTSVHPGGDLRREGGVTQSSQGGYATLPKSAKGFIYNKSWHESSTFIPASSAFLGDHESILSVH